MKSFWENNINQYHFNIPFPWFYESYIFYTVYFLTKPFLVKKAGWSVFFCMNVYSVYESIVNAFFLFSEMAELLDFIHLYKPRAGLEVRSVLLQLGVVHVHCEELWKEKYNTCSIIKHKFISWSDNQLAFFLWLILNQEPHYRNTETVQ